MTVEQLLSDPRVTVRRRGAPDSGGDAVVYWMQRAQRAADNPALDLAIEVGNLLHKPVVVFFGLHPFVRGANLRHYTFLVDGMRDLDAELRERRVGFVFRSYPTHRLLPFLQQVRPVMLVGDENPLRQLEGWREIITEEVAAPFVTVDADVIVPTRLLETEQYAARTIRPRLHRHVAHFRGVPPVTRCRIVWQTTCGDPALEDAEDILSRLPVSRDVGPSPDLRGGAQQARRRLREFVQNLASYDTARNHPELDGTSRLSPYLHFGQIGPRTVEEAIRTSGAPQAAVDAFIEQVLVRRELAINYVKFNDAYDRLEGCEAWARQTLRQHRFDARTHLYTPEQFAAAETHDALWNAAQRQMTMTGWMHGYLRMYWAKKILEWSASPEEAFDTAVRLNDRYEVDGRDPNGYTNIAWAIGGKHDRPWPRRPIYGSIRSMSFASTRRKFDSARYIDRWAPQRCTELT